MMLKSYHEQGANSKFIEKQIYHISFAVRSELGGLAADAQAKLDKGEIRTIEGGSANVLIPSDFHLVAEYACTEFKPRKKKFCVLLTETIRVSVSYMRFVAAPEPASGLMLDEMKQAYMKLRKTAPD